MVATLQHKNTRGYAQPTSGSHDKRIKILRCQIILGSSNISANIISHGLVYNISSSPSSPRLEDIYELQTHLSRNSDRSAGEN